MKKRLYLTEDGMKVFMTKREKELKRRLIDLLKDDGKGHKHAKYAARLANYDVQIVPLKTDPDFTAAISFDDGIIFIGEGFLNDPNTFYQLNVLLRHELAHNLLMHQIRMMKAIGEPAWQHLQYSSIMHNLSNILGDFEISNKKYSEEDKQIVKNMWVNGHIISGLVTEDHRKNWQDMDLLEMYQAILEEIAKIQQNLTNQTGSPDMSDFIQNNIAAAYIYTDISSPSVPDYKIETFIKSREYKKLPTVVQQIVKDLYDKIVMDQTTEYTEERLEEFLKKIAISSPFEIVALLSPTTGELITELYTPEEKWLVVEILKNMLQIDQEEGEEENTFNWYDIVTSLVGNGDYTEAEIKQIIDAMND